MALTATVVGTFTQSPGYGFTGVCTGDWYVAVTDPAVTLLRAHIPTGTVTTEDISGRGHQLGQTWAGKAVAPNGNAVFIAGASGATQVLEITPSTGATAAYYTAATGPQSPAVGRVAVLGGVAIIPGNPITLIDLGARSISAGPAAAGITGGGWGGVVDPTDGSVVWMTRSVGSNPSSAHRYDTSAATVAAVGGPSGSSRRAPFAHGGKVWVPGAGASTSIDPVGLTVSTSEPAFGSIKEALVHPRGDVCWLMTGASSGTFNRGTPATPSVEAVGVPSDSSPGYPVGLAADGSMWFAVIPSSTSPTGSVVCVRIPKRGARGIGLGRGARMVGTT